MSFATVANQKIFYVQAGKAGTPMIFVHGAAGSHLVWGFQLRALSELTHVIALDLPGHGRSDPPGRNSIQGYGEVVLGLLDELNIARAIIVGHSMGGAIAQWLALSHPERVAGLGLVGTGARLRVLPAILDGLLKDFDATAELVVDHSYAQPLDTALRERALAEFRACPASVTHGDFSACNTFDLMTRLGEIRAPTLVVCGKEDQMTPVKYSEFLATHITGARLVVIDGAGHSVMLEQPLAVNRALSEFVSNLLYASI